MIEYERKAVQGGPDYRAAELLLTTDQTVTYIAMEVGYANVKTFNRNFLRFKVMTPGDFRKMVALQESRL